MASLVTRAAAAAAALPSGRARRLGSGRLSLAALPGHGAVVLAGRRDGTGRAGVLSFVLKATGGETPAAPYEGSGSDTEFELVEKLRMRLLRDRLHRSMKGGKKIMFSEVGKPLHINSQVQFVSSADSAFSLWATVANRFRPSVDSKLYRGLEQCGGAFVEALEKGRTCRATCQDAAELVDAMDILRRLASAALQMPLPLDWEASLMVEHHDPDMVLCEMVRRHVMVLITDVESMLEGGDDADTARATSA